MKYLVIYSPSKKMKVEINELLKNVEFLYWHNPIMTKLVNHQSIKIRNAVTKNEGKAPKKKETGSRPTIPRE